MDEDDLQRALVGFELQMESFVERVQEHCQVAQGDFQEY